MLITCPTITQKKVKNQRNPLLRETVQKGKEGRGGGKDEHENERGQGPRGKGAQIRRNSDGAQRGRYQMARKCGKWTRCDAGGLHNEASPQRGGTDRVSKNQVKKNRDRKTKEGTRNKEK